MKPRGKKKILIIDDEQAVRDLFAHTLEPDGFDIVTVANPNEGMEAAIQTEPDIIYLSLLFPESNGLKVSKALHSAERLKDIPIVVLISYQGELDPKYTKTIGIVDVLVKPLRPSDIRAMTARLLGEEISAEGDEAASGEEEVEVSQVGSEDVDLHLSGSSDERMFEEPEHVLQTADEEVFSVNDRIEEAESQADLPPGSGEREDPGIPDFAGEEESRRNGVALDAPDEEKESDVRSFAAGGESALTGQDEEEGTDSEVRLKTRKSPGGRYFLFVALVILVAAVVFAALQAGILPGGGRNGKILKEVVRETPVEKEKVGEATEPAGAEGKAGSGDIQPEEKPLEKGLPASRSSAGSAMPSGRQSSQPAPNTATRAVNEGLKEPKALRGQGEKIYSVQVGVFGKEGNAVSFAEELRKKGYDAFLEKVGDRGLHRVLVGRFSDYRQARGQSEVLLKKDGIKSIIYRH